MKSQFVFIGVACLAVLFASGSYAGVTIDGTTITFNDGTTQSTADTGGGGAPADHGGTGNTVWGFGSFIGGGASNFVTDDYGTIGGGYDNQAGDNAGITNDHRWATVAGGTGNTASGISSMVGGGRDNTASGNEATVGGGNNNRATEFRSTVGGGQQNSAFGDFSTVGGGANNIARGVYSTIAGGWANTANGDYSFVAGLTANDGGYNNVFVWDDGTGFDPDEPSDATADNTFNVYASGGIFWNGGGVHTSSDRNMKEAFSFVSAREVLDKVVEMPVTSWRFKSEDDSIRHIGPVAQDFMAAFGYGVDDTHITSTDADGVALAAIQGLNERLEEQLEVNTALRWHNAQLEARLARLEKAILRESEPAQTGTD